MDKAGHSWSSVPVKATILPMCCMVSHLGTATTEWCSSSAAVVEFKQNEGLHPLSIT